MQKNKRQGILDYLEQMGASSSRQLCEKLGISRQALNLHIRELIGSGKIFKTGATRSAQYHLTEFGPKPVKFNKTLRLASLDESAIYDDLATTLNLKSVLSFDQEAIIHYAFTEMLNNAIDHSSGSRVIIHIEKTASTTNIMIIDDGEGIFKKIQRELGLSDERHSVLELAKGKLTTDPNHHSGEGIFFSSRMFDRFAISSGSTYFSHEFDKTEDWIIEHKENKSGTAVFMYLSNNSSRTSKGVFDNFTLNDDYGFTKTIVPVHLAQYGDDQLISRSQAKRLLVRIEKFKKVIFDFDEVETIGQAFADEIFRVFQLQHKEMELVAINTQKQVQQMISRALSKE